MRLKHTILTIFAASFLWSCKDDCCTESPDNFDVSTILTNLADNIVPQRYDVLGDAALELKQAAVAFNASPDQINLNALRIKFKTAYKAWQINSVSNYGYSSTNGLRGIMNTFPTDTAEIKLIFAASSPNYAQASYIDATGFPGLDFVLYSKNDTEVLERFTTNSNAQGAKDYLLAITTGIYDHAVSAFNFWENDEGGYKSKFTANTSKSAGSDFSDVVNEFVWDVEFMKNYQLSYPAGKYTLDIPRPELAESFYGKCNIELYKEHLLALKAYYKGEDDQGANRKGFDDYLIELGTEKSGTLLNTLILDQFDVIEAKIDQMVGDLNNAVDTQPVLITELFNENKLLVSYFKVDMCSAFAVQLTYTDNDGD